MGAIHGFSPQGSNEKQWHSADLETKTVVHNSTNSRARVDQLPTMRLMKQDHAWTSAAGGASVKLQSGLELGPFVVLCT